MPAVPPGAERQRDEDDTDADQAARQLDRRGETPDDGSGHPAVLDGEHQRGGHQPDHQQVVVEAADPVGQHQW